MKTNQRFEIFEGETLPEPNKLMQHIHYFLGKYHFELEHYFARRRENKQRRAAFRARHAAPENANAVRIKTKFIVAVLALSILCVCAFQFGYGVGK